MVAHEGPKARTKFDADRETAAVKDSVSILVNSPRADMFKEGEADESSLVPVFGRRPFVGDICFGSETFEGCLSILNRLLQRFTECRISVSFTKSIFVQPRVDFLSHTMSPAGIHADVKKMNSVANLPFRKPKKGVQSFLGGLNYYSRFVQDFAVYAAALYQAKDDDFGVDGNLNAAKQSFTILQQKVVEAPILRHFDRAKPVYVTLFANEWALSLTLLQKHDEKIHPVQFCGRKRGVFPITVAEGVLYATVRSDHTCLYTVFDARLGTQSKTLFGRTTQFAVMLSPWYLVDTRVKEKECAFANCYGLNKRVLWT
ncbi:hypothetical protein PHMEG_00010798 [Phytophthora megakarya]|uniref:Reverse transcriptase/retrotransposon-derived protein RNase H-like domain-containing protein n=1 Tax=Phytophthora megakarya TaxID=4795 RepID=A0A225WCS1_9STRA|nr:hypothetical protein PHMEG_00010798 [Phytophthora megakarya]